MSFLLSYLMWLVPLLAVIGWLAALREKAMLQALAEQEGRAPRQVVLPPVAANSNEPVLAPGE